jgi:outer membrane receptor protein involved in Fe transport
VNWQQRFIDSQLNNIEDNEEFREPRSIPSVWYSDFRAGYQLTEQVNVFAGVDNVFDKAPPRHPFVSRGGSFYSIVGRSFYGGVRVNF